MAITNTREQDLTEFDRLEKAINSAANAPDISVQEAGDVMSLMRRERISIEKEITSLPQTEFTSLHWDSYKRLLILYGLDPEHHNPALSKIIKYCQMQQDRTELMEGTNQVGEINAVTPNLSRRLVSDINTVEGALVTVGLATFMSLVVVGTGYSELTKDVNTNHPVYSDSAMRSSFGLPPSANVKSGQPQGQLDLAKRLEFAAFEESKQNYINRKLGSSLPIIGGAIGTVAGALSLAGLGFVRIFRVRK